MLLPEVNKRVLSGIKKAVRIAWKTHFKWVNTDGTFVVKNTTETKLLTEHHAE